MFSTIKKRRKADSLYDFQDISKCNILHFQISFNFWNYFVNDKSFWSFSFICSGWCPLLQRFYDSISYLQGSHTETMKGCRVVLIPKPREPSLAKVHHPISLFILYAKNTWKAYGQISEGEHNDKASAKKSQHVYQGGNQQKPRYTRL